MTIRLNANDNTVVARLDILPNTELGIDAVRTTQRIPAGHKVAICPIAKGEPIRKFNQIIGFASQDIAPGEHVHVQNCVMQDFDRDYAVGADVKPIDYVPENQRPSFQGYLRADGRAATRNYIGILSTVNCSATVCKFIAERFPREVLAQYPNVDGVVAITHSTGCGMADAGEGYGNLQRTLWGFARHPNFAAVLMIGLGCEVNQIDFLLDAYQIKPGPNFRTMTMQATGGTRKTIERAHEIIQEMLPGVNEYARQPVSVSEISLALQCGGSDGYSGITANPALGHAADLLVRNGGTAILSETPEIYGAEHLLTRRAVDQKIADKLIDRIKWWENYTSINGGEMNNNPSPGNKAGGLTTILEKSLGAAAKGGTLNLNGVYKYAEPVTARGFVFMDSPGYDPAAVTGQVASGANMVTFTTGRGSCFGFKPAPSIKIATNSAMYRRIEEDMDINAGTIVEGSETIEQVGQRIFDKVIEVASGTPSKSEELGVGDHEFVPWMVGAVM
ncbi:UxaA family hydrolase [Geminicoccus roseus]|uniref:UxaA family hydrolase n=1 Tax=Geminicoccus roseus TaxID=404900 RepID=UPI000552CEA2|nr:altronate dehydratase family protein [Geminicoccus roseus]